MTDAQQTGGASLPDEVVPRHGSGPAARAGVGAVPSCENCGAALLGEYCHHCGQSRESPLRSLRAFLTHVLGEVASLDTRLLRSLRLLLTRPGELTWQYAAGRRVRYLQPWQVYLACATVFFIVNAYHPILRFDTRSLMLGSQVGGTAMAYPLSPAQVTALAARGIRLEDIQARVDSVVAGYLPACLLGSLLLFSLVVAGLYVRRRRPLMLHLIFTLHWAGFFLLLMTVDSLLPGKAWWGSAIFVAIETLYLGLALQRSYGGRWWGTVWRTPVLGLLFHVTQLAFLASAIQVALALL